MFTLTLRIPDSKKAQFLQRFLAGENIGGVTPKRAAETKIRRLVLEECRDAVSAERQSVVDSGHIVDITLVNEPE